MPKFLPIHLICITGPFVPVFVPWETTSGLFARKTVLPVGCFFTKREAVQHYLQDHVEMHMDVNEACNNPAIVIAAVNRMIKSMHNILRQSGDLIVADDFPNCPHQLSAIAETWSGIKITVIKDGTHLEEIYEMIDWQPAGSEMKEPVRELEMVVA